MDSSRKNVVEVIPDRLYWLSDKDPPKGIPNAFYFNVDNDLQYTAFFNDFGPHSIAKIFRFIQEVDKLLSSSAEKKVKVFHYTGTEPQKLVNSVLLMGCFMIARLGLNWEVTTQRFSGILPPLLAYRDATMGPCKFKCTTRHCFRGFEHALRAGLLNLQTFDLEAYEKLEKSQNGDINWVVPQKLLACGSPGDKRTKTCLVLVEQFAQIMQKLGVGLVIRLNHPNYDQSKLVAAGVRHVDLLLEDGASPNLEAVGRFLALVEKEKGAVAVHSRAGLGRTGTLIACFLIKHYHFCAADAIAFVRIMRPGSVHGPQQYFLVENQTALWSQPSNTYAQMPPTFHSFVKRMKETDDCRL